MLRLYFENNKSSSDLNSNNIFEADSLPIPGRKEYSCLGEVVEEFVSNWEHIIDTIDRIIKKNTLLYQDHSDTDHSDMDSHCDDFYAFDWGDGYTVYIYKYRVEMGIIVSLTKEFVLENPGCTTHFLIGAVIVDESNLLFVSERVENIRKKYFQQGEIKSSKIGRNHKRRVSILTELKQLPFHVFAFVCDKRKIYENSGLRYKQSFYKFLNNIVHQELRISYNNLTITADEVGGNDYLQSFATYVRSKEIPLDLFDNSLFRFENSKHSIIIQVADIVCGSLAYNYDIRKISESDGYNYKSVLGDKILRIKEFPETFDTFNVSQNDLNPEYNPQIADICYRKAKHFIETHNNTDDDEVKQQIAVLNYLLFRFMNKSPRKYIPTQELITQLVYLGYDRLSLQTFRNKIIAKLRDNEVIISSSSGGYKIPSTEKELYDFVNHGKSIIMPMLARLKTCNDVIRMGTNGEINLFEKAEYHSLAKMFDTTEQ